MCHKRFFDYSLERAYVRKITHQLLDAVSFCHQHNVSRPKREVLILKRFDHWLSLKLTQRQSVKKCTYERVVLKFLLWRSCITAFWFTVDLWRCCQEAYFQHVQQSSPEIIWGRNVCVHRCRNCLQWVTDLSSRFYRSLARKLALLSGQKSCCAQISILLRSDKISFSASWHLQQRSTAYGVLLLNWWTAAGVSPFPSVTDN